MGNPVSNNNMDYIWGITFKLSSDLYVCAHTWAQTHKQETRNNDTQLESQPSKGRGKKIENLRPPWAVQWGLASTCEQQRNSLAPTTILPVDYVWCKLCSCGQTEVIQTSTLCATWISVAQECLLLVSRCFSNVFSMTTFWSFLPLSYCMWHQL